MLTGMNNYFSYFIPEVLLNGSADSRSFDKLRACADDGEDFDHEVINKK